MSRAPAAEPQVPGANQDQVRAFNRGLVLGLIRQAGTTSRAALAKRVTLTPPTVSAIVDELVREGLVTEIGVATRRAGRGRPPKLIAFNARARFVAGIHIGVRTTQIALADAGGDEVAMVTRSAPRGAPEVQLDAIVAMLRDLLDANGVPLQRVVGVGVCVPGRADATTGICRVAPNLGWHDVPVAPRLAAALSVPVFLHNDAQMALLAEAAEGVARGCRDVVLLYAGSGISASAMLDGRIFHGSTGAMGEIGHCAVEGGTATCNCGKTGCLETLASGPAIARAYAEAVHSDVVLDAAAVVQAAQRDDAVAARVLEEAGARLGAAAAVLVNLFDPEMLVFGGGLSGAGPALVDPLVRRLRAEALVDGGRELPIALSSLGERAELRGAVLLALTELGMNSEAGTPAG